MLGAEAPSYNRRVRGGTALALGGSGRAWPLVGREGELARLVRVLDEARTGRTAVAVVSGPAGVGKSALVRSWLTRIEVEPVVVSGEEGEQRLDLGVFDQLVRRLGGSPVLGERPDPVVGGGALVRALAPPEGQPARVVVVEDAHWADEASMRALLFASRRLLVEPVVVVLVTRDEAAVPEGLVRLAEHGVGEVVRLPPLTPGDVGEVVEAVCGVVLSSAGRRRLHIHTEGTPIHVRALLEELDTAVLDRLGAPLPAPRSFALVVAARLADLSPGAASLVTAAAVLGYRSGLAVAAKVGAVDDPLDALAGAVDRGVLVAEASGAVVAFPHALVRAAVLDLLGPARRSTLHLAAARVLDGAAALDQRVAGTLVEDQALAAEVERAAWPAATAGEPSRAAGLLLDAARLAGPRRHDDLVIDAVMVLVSGGRVDEARGLRTTVAACVPSAKKDLVSGMLSLFAGDQAEAERLLAAAWATGGHHPRWPIRSVAAGYLAQLTSIQARSGDTLRWAERAFEASGSRLVPPALSVRLCQLEFMGRCDEVDAEIATAVAIPDLPDDVRAYLTLARALVALWRGGYADAHRLAGEALHHARPLLSNRFGLITLGYLAEASFRSGRWDEATVHATTAVALGDDADQRWTAAFLHSMCVLPLAGRGAWDAAEAHVAAGLAAAARLDDIASTGHARSAAMWLAACRHRPVDVVSLAAPLRTAVHRASLDHPGCHFAWETLLVDALVDLGRVDEAGEVVDDLVRRAGGPAAALAFAARGRVAAARRDLDPARASFASADAALDPAVQPVEAALVDLAHGEVLRRAGQRGAALDRLSAATAGFTRLGARPWVERCHREVAACGATPRRRDDHARWHLTPQELAVARLVSAGATNREVATELVIGVKTVEYHLANAFRKLGIARRGELSALVNTPGPEE